MGFTEATRTCLGKYFTFSGRASRSEYWWFFLFAVLGNFASGVLDGVLFGVPGAGPVNAVFSLLMIVPALSAGWRRMHDTGRSGLYLLYPFMAVAGILSYAGFLNGMEETLGEVLTAFGGLVLVVAVFILTISPLIVLWWLTRPSQSGENMYGPQPLR